MKNDPNPRLSRTARKQRQRIWLGAAATLVALTGAYSHSSRAADDVSWPSYNGNYAGDRFSPLREISRENIQKLAEVGRYTLPETTSFQAGPIAIGDALYVTSPTGTYALNSATAKLLWSQQYPAKSLGLGTGIRGAAHSDGVLYRGMPDSHLLAMDAKTGRTIWDVEAFDTSKGEYIAAAPVVWEGRVCIANAGSDVGGIGHIRAFDAKDGHRLWNFDIVPSSGPGSETWPSDTKKVRAGGGIYTSFALDTSDGSLYTPAGNPGPDFAGEYRPGANLYTGSVLRLDARTGSLRGYHQFVHHDVHDWDMAASPMLFTSKAGHRMVVAAGKNGFLYGMDPSLSKVLYAVPVTTHENIDAPLTVAGTRFCPGTQGGVNWNGPAYSPLENAVYVNSIEWCTVITLSGTTPEHKFGVPFLGSSNAFGDSDAHAKTGWLYAVDAESGKLRWRYRAPTPLVAAVTPTAGGLVFTGDLDGNLLAFDAATGKLLLTKKVGGPIGGGIATYTSKGRQYIAVAAGMKSAIIKTDSGPASLVIYAVP
jgi:PQQ-dependent dehydrogenase (methanol/ethanol family)